MAKRLVAANSRRLAALALLGGLCACATNSAEPRPEAQPAGWRIVERIGEARYVPPGAAGWVPAAVGETLADGSEVTTGRGGRLIVDAPGRHISVGPDSRFVLPDPDRHDQLDQRAGWLRYRIAEAEAQPFRIHTRSLELELLAGVVDVHVNHLATEVTVKQGQVRVATPDGLRQSQMIAGQSAHAAGTGDVQLAVRPAPGAALQPVQPVILPALHPKSMPPERPSTSAPADPPAPGSAALLPSDAAAAPRGERAAREEPRPTEANEASKAEQPRGALPPAPRPTAPASARPGPASDRLGTAVTATVPPSALRSGAPDRATDPRGPRTAESAAAAARRGKFERLTAGMLDEVQPPRHAPAQP